MTYYRTSHVPPLNRPTFSIFLKAVHEPSAKSVAVLPLSVPQALLLSKQLRQREWHGRRGSGKNSFKWETLWLRIRTSFGERAVQEENTCGSHSKTGNGTYSMSPFQLPKSVHISWAFSACCIPLSHPSSLTESCWQWFRSCSGATSKRPPPNPWVIPSEQTCHHHQLLNVASYR